MSAGENKLPFPPLYICVSRQLRKCRNSCMKLECVLLYTTFNHTLCVLCCTTIYAICRAVVTRHSRSSAMTPLEISSSHIDDFLLTFHSNCPWNHLQDIARHGRADNGSVGHGSNGPDDHLHFLTHFKWVKKCGWLSGSWIRTCDPLTHNPLTDV